MTKRLPTLPPHCPRVHEKAGFSQWEDEPIWTCGHIVVWLKRKVVTGEHREIPLNEAREWMRVAANDIICSWMDAIMRDAVFYGPQGNAVVDDWRRWREREEA